MATFLDGAAKTLDIALYDLRLDDAPGNTLFAAKEPSCPTTPSDF